MHTHFMSPQESWLTNSPIAFRRPHGTRSGNPLADPPFEAYRHRWSGFAHAKNRRPNSFVENAL
jgi:hypothetical protein